jgi:tetratricopeptide (TPR) repeat protein
MKRLALIMLFVIAAAEESAVAGQNVLNEVKAQYEAAAYEDALATLSRAGEVTAGDAVEIEQYRALCLLALGRNAEAARALTALVATDPTYMPSPSVASPKVLSMLTEIRKRELPAAVRRLMDTGRTAYQAKDFGRARENFSAVLKLLDSPAMVDRAEREDLRAVADGFVTLADASLTHSTARGDAAPPAPPSAARSTATAPSTAAAPESGSAPSSAAENVFVPAVAIVEKIPGWEPPSRAFASVEYRGTLKLRIDREGKVAEAIMEENTNAAYDGRLLQAARTWLYKPATRNGVPIESEKRIAIVLRPPN